MGIEALTYRQLTTYVAVADHLSFTKAAAELHTAQSAVSVTVRDIEKRLGVGLLDRDTRNVALTPAGVRFQALARSILDAQASAARDFDSFLAGDTGELIISALPSVSAVSLPPIISEFTRENPGVQIQLRDRIASDVIADLLAGEADIGITSIGGIPEEVQIRELVSHPLVAVLPPNHPLTELERVTWRQLAAEPLVTIRHGGVQPLLDRAFNVIDARVTSYVEASSIQSIAGLVSAGLGVSVLPSQAVPMLAFSGVETRGLTEPTVFQKLCLARLASRHLSPVATRFIDRLERSMLASVTPPTTG